MTIEEYHAELNNSRYLPDDAYRWDAPRIDLVYMVNNCIALYISRNWSLMPEVLFGIRAYLAASSQPKELVATELERLDSEPYVRLVKSYVSAITAFLIANGVAVPLELSAIL